MKAVLAWLLVLVLAGCGGERTPAAVPPEYGPAPVGAPVCRFAVLPLHNPQRLHAVFQPMMAHLDARVPEARFELEASRDFAAFEAKLENREVAFALVNPYEVLMARRHGYRVFAKMADDGDFRGIFVVRRDSGLKRVADLKGRAVAYPAPTALAAGLQAQYFLHANGVDVNRDIENRYVGSHDSSILAAYHRQVAAGATWPITWRVFQRTHPKEAAELEVAWQTPTLPNLAFVVRDDVPEGLSAQALAALVGMAADAQGQAILRALEFTSVVAADDTSYEPVRRFVRDFSARVRPIETYE